MDQNLFEVKVSKLVSKVKHYLVTRWGKLVDQASDELFYEAFSFAFREEIMINWTASFKTYRETNPKMLYYFSMEYLPGKILENTIKSLKAEEIAKEATKRLQRNYDQIMHKEREPGLGNGGLGRLASCFLDSLATLKIPTMGYGLRYQYGTFEQEICYGTQMERPDRWLLHYYPWAFRRDDQLCTIKFSGKTTEIENEVKEKCESLHDYEEVGAVPFDIPIIGYSDKPDFTVASMRLWSTKESPRNFRLQIFNSGKMDEAAENTHLTDVLYPNDNHDMGKRFRLKQEYLLVSASLQDLFRRHLAINKDLKNLSDKVRIQINDTHPALTVAEMTRLLIKDHNFTFQQAWETTSSCISFTNHTVMAEALEEWKVERFTSLLPRQYKVIEKINEHFVKNLPAEFSDPKVLNRLKILDHEHVKMANLSIVGSTKVNGVAKLHTEILKKKTFEYFYKLYPEKFLNVTNGVTPRRWLFHCNPLLTRFISEKIGENWQYHFEDLQKLHAHADDPAAQDAFLEIKRKNKEVCIEYICKYNDEFRSYDPFVKNMYPLGPDSLFDMHIKRIHEYKRQLLKLIHTIIIYQELLEDTASRKVKRSIFFGGKAAPGYQKARDLIYLIHIIARKINQDPKTHEKLRLLFVENYNVSKAEILIPASDLSEQISLAGKEASGTGNMKLAMNGSLTIGTEDGANIEMRESVTDTFWPFRFGATKEEVQKMHDEMSYYPNHIYNENPKIKKALDALKDNTFAESDFEKQITHEFYHYLVEGFNPDPYFVLYDLDPYYQTQKKVEDLYSNPREWARLALHNIASMTPFSSDVSIRNYAEHIWHIQPVEIKKEIYDRVKQDFDTNNSCTVVLNGEKK